MQKINSNKVTRFKTKQELEKTILLEKEKGTSDIEIGNKYGVTFRYIEKVITKSKGVNISNLQTSKRIKRLHPKNFKEEQTTVWSFKNRGKWATHRGDYRGNWSPYIPRNVILKYSKPGDIVLDYFCGAGTTTVEAKLLGRRCVAFDINDKAIELSKRNCNFKIDPQHYLFEEMEEIISIYEPELFVGDARKLTTIKDNSIHLICAHPPYSDIIHYTDGKEGDLSFYGIDTFLEEMSKVAKESFRVLKPGRKCAILIGDTRRKKHIIPLGFWTIDVYLKAGFRLRELVIKRQHNCKTTGFWYTNSIKYNFLLLAHEYLPIFEKPKQNIILKDKKGDKYTVNISKVSEELKQKKKLSEFETTSVWIFPEKDYEKLLNKNIIDRYAEDQNYSCVSLSIGKKTKENNKKGEKGNSLLFIKIDLDNENISQSALDGFILKLNGIVEKKLPQIEKNGFVVIETKDKRVNGYIESLAKRIISTLTNDKLWLKEIVFVTTENQKENLKSNNEKYLTVAHRYLLVYEVTSIDK